MRCIDRIDVKKGGQLTLSVVLVLQDMIDRGEAALGGLLVVILPKDFQPAVP